MTSEQIMRYLALLGDPRQNEITRDAWTVATTVADMPWAGWRPESVVSVPNEPPDEWYQQAGSVHARPNLAEIRAVGLSASVEALMHNESLVPTHPQATNEPLTPPPGMDDDGFRNLALRERLHREESLGRVGWIFVAGTVRLGSTEIPCCFPLFHRRVKFERVGTMLLPHWQGALQHNQLLARTGEGIEPDLIDQFLLIDPRVAGVEAIGRGAKQLLVNLGVSVDTIADPEVHPTSVSPQQGTVIVPGAGFYLAKNHEQLSDTANDLSRWTGRSLSDTALAHLYRTTDARSGSVRDAQPIRTTLPMNGRQREVIERLTTEPVVTVSGPPGTGKTHTIVATASDFIARGLSVLVATKSNFAAESACELLDRYPTPPHVRFGNERHRRRVADELSAGQMAGPSDEQLRRIADAANDARNERDRVQQTIVDALGRKQSFAHARASNQATAASGAPHMLESGFAFTKLDGLLRELSTATGVRARIATGRLRRLIGAASNATLNDMQRSIAGARAERAIQDALENALGDDLDKLWVRLEACEAGTAATQALLDKALRSKPNPEALTAVSALAMALRSTTGPRKLRLPLDANAAFLHHVPFWVGTLEEIETSLPTHPGMFDVVIFDEASQIDQLAAVPALCRARQALVVGDPEQLRHRPTVTANQIEAARTHAGVVGGDQAAILDIAANSLFDVAASRSPVTWLDEHFRSAPHLIQFSSRRWYRNQLRLMTQHPRNENLDLIDTYRVVGQRTDTANPAEVAAIVERLRAYQHVSDGRSIGVVTPFDDQARLLEQAIVDRFSYDDIRAMRLRVGTVRGVQGTERDTILLSLVLDENDFEAALPLIEDRHMFNVMLTRARSRIEVFHSFDPDALPAGLLADWFDYERNPPGIGTRSSPPSSQWTQDLAEALDLAQVRVVTNYPVAGWTLDIVVGEGHAAFGVETTVHSQGPEAHIDRHLTLRRAGWDLVSAFENNWLLHAEDAAIYLAGIAARRASAG